MKKLSYIILIVFTTGLSCKEVYNPPVQSPVTGYLVVEGFINSGNGRSTITLTRTTKLVDTAMIVYEAGAQVDIEADNGAFYPLTAKDSGNYVSGNISLDPALKYRMHIQTKDGKEYASDFTPVKYTPAIDSINWQSDNGGIRIFVNTHDAQSNTAYYRFKYSETWEFHSTYLSSLAYARDPATNSITGLTFRKPFHNVDSSIYKCWRTLNPSAILLGSTEKLNENIIHLPVQYIEPQSQKLSVLYSLELKQYAVSKAAYLFYQNLRKNTEQLGSIFDAQPSQLGGNIHCINDSAAMAIGYVEVAQEQVQRIFIHNTDVPDWGYSYGFLDRCAAIEVKNELDEIQHVAPDYMPTNGATFDGFGGLITFFAAPPLCVDCTLSGTNVKPSFWP